MSHKWKGFPADLRALCGGAVDDPDGSQRALLFPARAYANVVEVRRELERRLSDGDLHIEDLVSLRLKLEFVKKEEADIERRILEGKNLDFPGDHGAKSKLEKAVVDVKAGRFDHTKGSKTLKAVYTAWDYRSKNRRMPSHAELKSFGFNDQQATDAGSWFAMQAGPVSNERSLFQPLHRPKQGRPKKK